MNTGKSRAGGAMFLHGGSSAIPEQIRFGDSLGISWWMQPRPDEQSAQPYKQLVAAAENELRGLACDAGGAVKIYASSLGALLAIRLAAGLPQLISGITLLGPVGDPTESFVRLGARLAGGAVQSEVLREKVASLRSRMDDRDRLWSLVQTISSVPGFLDLYWSPKAKLEGEWFARLFSNPEVFGLDAFHRLLNGLLLEEPVEAPVAFNGPVVAFLGSYDPLIDVDEEGSWWKQRFPQIKIHVVPTGHYPHLELPSREWV
jgi:pimeloyl-ACP methyl ester carboxylesterase